MVLAPAEPSDAQKRSLLRECHHAMNSNGVDLKIMVAVDYNWYSVGDWFKAMATVFALTNVTFMTAASLNNGTVVGGTLTDARAHSLIQMDVELTPPVRNALVRYYQGDGSVRVVPTIVEAH